VTAKVEHIEGKSNPRFVVLRCQPQSGSLNNSTRISSARGDMETRIKEQLSLFADREFLAGESDTDDGEPAVRKPGLAHD